MFGTQWKLLTRTEIQRLRAKQDSIVMAQNEALNTNEPFVRGLDPADEAEAAKRLVTSRDAEIISLRRQVASLKRSLDQSQLQSSNQWTKHSQRCRRVQPLLSKWSGATKKQREN